MNECLDEGNHQDAFEAEGEISEEGQRQLEEYVGLDTDRSVDGEAVTLFREKSRFSIGTPVSLPLKDYLSLSGRIHLSELQGQMKAHEFCAVQLACSFLPAAGCRFHDARLDIALQVLPASAKVPDPKVPFEAIAYDLFPNRTEDKVEVTRRRGGGLEAHIATGPTITSLSVPLPQTEEQDVLHKVYVEAFGLQNHSAGWRFNRTSSRQISGSHPLLLLVRKPKGTSVQATFNLTAHVEVLIGQSALDVLLPLVLLFRRHGSSSTISDPTVSLC